MRTFNPRRFRDHHFQTRQAGLTLLGLAIAVALSAVIFAGLAYFVGVIIDGNKTTNAIQYVDAMESNIQTLYQGNANGFTNATSASLQSSGLIPKPLLDAGNLTSPFGTAFTLQPATDGASAGGIQNALEISLPVPTSQCTAFVKGVEANFGEVSVGGTTLKDDLAGTAFSATDLSTACGAATGGTAAVDLYIVD